MTMQPAYPSSSGTRSSLAPLGERQRAALGGVSLWGLYLFVTSLLVFGSGVGSLRPNVFGLLLHPFLIPLVAAFPFVVGRFTDLPLRILISLFAFSGIYCFSALNGGHNPLGEVFKMVCTVLTILTYAVAMRRPQDLVAATLGMAIGVAGLGLRGLQGAGWEGVMAIDVANKNSYSLYALPTLLLIGYICLYMPTTLKSVKAALLVCAIPILLAIFMSGNRSGYIGAVLVGLMLFWDRRGKGMLLVGALAAVVAFGVMKFGGSEMIEHRWQVTLDGKNDQIRRDLMFACFDIGLNNPVIGVGPQELMYEIAKLPSTKYRIGISDPHNVFASIWAGSGLICFSMLLAFAWSLCSWKRGNSGKLDRDDPLRDARRLMWMLVLLWVVRGMFTPDILYNPCFNMAFGLVIGLCMLAQAEPRGARAVSPKPLPAGYPAVLPRVAR